MFKIFQIMNKISKFSNQMAEFSSSPDYDKEKTKRKDIPKKQKSKKKSKKKSKNTTTAKPEILGFDYKRIGDRMLNQDRHNDEM